MNASISRLKNPDVKDKMIALLPKVNGQPMIVGPGDNYVNFSPDCFPYGPPNAAAGTPSNPFGGRGMLSYDGFDESPRWTFGDTLTWTRGAHSFNSASSSLCLCAFAFISFLGMRDRIRFLSSTRIEESVENAVIAGL
jgi:hypothetical protein